MSDQRLKKSDRLRRRADFDRVHGSDAFAADQVLVVRGCQNDLAYSRLGISVSRKVGGAVVRNRWKRLIREAFRTQKRSLPQGLDLVVRPRRDAQPGVHAVRAALVRLAQRIAGRLGRKRE